MFDNLTNYAQYACVAIIIIHYTSMSYLWGLHMLRWVELG